MRSAIFLTLAVVITLPINIDAQTGDRRIDRLVGLAKVWTTVKYYHPFLADRPIDWDRALIVTIPKVNSASSDAEFAAAIDSMLAVLGDPVTRVEPSVPMPTVSQATTPVTPVTEANGVIRIDLAGAAKALFDRTGKSQMIIPTLEKMLPDAKAVVIDSRSATPPNVEDYDAEDIYSAMNILMPLFLNESVNLDRPRYRLHDGYAPQDGTTSGGYHSSVLVDMPTQIAGKAERPIPITFVINDGSTDELAIWDAMQRRHLASVVYEGVKPPPFGVVTARIELPGKVTAGVRAIDLVNDTGPVVFTPDRIVKPGAGDPAMKQALDNATSPVWAAATSDARPSVAQNEHENPYSDMSYPPGEYRLLALFRFWGVIDTFYPYKDLIADTWATVLPRFIPKFEAAKDALSYQTTIYQMVTELHDSHGFIQGATVFDDDVGTNIPPVLVRFVEDHPVVVKILDDTVPLQVGDVIESVDGKSVAELLDTAKQLYVASTPQALLRATSTNLLRGKKDTIAHVAFRRNGTQQSIDVPRSLFRWDRKVFEGAMGTGPTVEVLPFGYGYVDLVRLTIAEVDDMFKKIASTKAVIFDMRGYPNGTAWSIAPRLTTKQQPAAALFSRQNISGRTLTDSDLSLSSFTFKQRLPPAKGEIYTGKVVMLIDDSAISQSEHTCLFFETATNVTFIGTPTIGANGDVTNMVLPGGIFIYFSGHSVRHIDGRQLQRLGIQPDVRVAPTMTGIKAGRDEILEAAVKFLKSTVK